MDKKDILAALDLYSKADLERLLTYASTMLIPDTDLLLKVTFSQMIDKAHTLADEHFPEWTDRSKADFGEFLIELFALFSEKDFWYVNGFANEAFSQKASAYTSVYMHALRLGYRPVQLKAASGVALVTFSAGSEEDIAPGELILTCIENGYKYTNSEYVNIPASAGTVVVAVNIIEGVYITVQKSFNGKSVQITDSTASIYDPVITVNTALWEYKASLANSTETSKHFIVFPTSFGIEIFFGDGAYGQAPAIQDAILVKYISTNGILGNLPASDPAAVSMTIQESPVARTANSATYAADVGFSGGTDSESVAKMRNGLDMFFRTRGDIINPYDCVAYLESLPTVRKATSYNFMHTLYYKVIPESGLHADQTLLDTLDLALRDIVIKGFTPYGLVTTYHEITELSFQAFILLGYDSAYIKSQIKEFLVNYTDPTVYAEYGQGFILGTVAQEMIKNIAGLQNVVFQTLNSVTAESLVIGEYDILEVLDPDNITISMYTE